MNFEDSSSAELRSTAVSEEISIRTPPPASSECGSSYNLILDVVTLREGAPSEGCHSGVSSPSTATPMKSAFAHTQSHIGGSFKGKAGWCAGNPPDYIGGGISPVPSVATTVNTEAIGDWEDSPSSICPSGQQRLDELHRNEPDAEDAPVGDGILEGAAAVISDLVRKGDEALRQIRPSRFRDTSLSDDHYFQMVRTTLHALRDEGVLPYPVCVTMVVYIRRLADIDPKIVSHLTIHRHLVATSVVANKICGDTYFPLRVYAQACSVPLDLVTVAELALLKHLHFDVQVQPSVYSGRSPKKHCDFPSLRSLGVRRQSTQSPTSSDSEVFPLTFEGTVTLIVGSQAAFM